jgi:Protein of unknown function (DUF998)
LTQDDSLTRRLILAGFIPMPLFVIGLGIAGLFAPDYHWMSQHGSELSLLNGLPQSLFKLTVIPWGLSFIAFGIGLMRMTGKRSMGAFCWVLFGIAMCSNGFWPMGNPMHGLYALPLVSLIAPAMSLAESDVLRGFKGMWFVTMLVSLCGLFYLWLNMLGFDPQAYRGLTQRLFSSINSFWPAFVAWRVWQGSSRG